MQLPDNLQTVVLLSFVVVGVAVLIMGGLTRHEFKRRNPAIEPRYDERTLERFSSHFPLMIAAGVGLILLDVIFLVGLTPDDNDLMMFGFVVEDALMAPFMALLAVAVGLLVPRCRSRSTTCPSSPTSRAAAIWEPTCRRTPW